MPTKGRRRKFQTPKHRIFPIVGIGASAGGLEALEAFLPNIPVDSGLAYIIVQHLDPIHKSILVDLLQQTTMLPVTEIRDQLIVEPNHIYIIPPGYDLFLLKGVLYVLEKLTSRGSHLPIDLFFRALADDRQQHSIGVVLSGMGSDGTLGLQAIKEKAGVTFVQSPNSAKFTGMPLSAIHAEVADVIAPPEQLPAEIIAYLQHRFLINLPKLELKDRRHGSLEKIILLVRTRTGHDFSLYKKSTLYRRVERRMGLHQLNQITKYIRYLQENPQEVDMLFKELLIGVSRFFRDPPVWEQLKNDVLPALLATNPTDGVLRAWVAGCSTGEEAYSLAMAFKEVLEEANAPGNLSLQIFATDMDKEAVDKARQGLYPVNIAADLTPDRLKRFFTEEELGFRLNKDIREMLIFAPHNLVMDPPFTKLDFLSCRNVLIYMEVALQDKLLALFYFSLNPRGFLLLGNSETIGAATNLFAPLSGKNRFYQRRESIHAEKLVEFPMMFPRSRTQENEALITKPKTLVVPNLQTLTEKLLLQVYTPPAVLVTEQGDILYVSGKTGKYLEPAVGRANVNLFAMARPGLSQALSEIFNKAIREQTTLTLKNIKVGTNGGTQLVNVTVQPLSEQTVLHRMLMVIFIDVPVPRIKKTSGKGGQPGAADDRMAALASELQHAHEALQTAREEMQTSQEELKSTNEELQSTNEELQSTNEELTTSKEEMQSMNEELQTVNSELRAKLEELSRTSDDMRNLLNSVNIAILFLDEALNVRRFTSQTASIIKLIPSDIGRPITDLMTELEYPQLIDDIREVLDTLIFKETEAPTKDGRWFMVRILPYRTQENRIDGAVITFTNISPAKQLEAELRKTQAELQERLTTQASELSEANTALQNMPKKNNS